MPLERGSGWPHRRLRGLGWRLRGLGLARVTRLRAGKGPFLVADGRREHGSANDEDSTDPPSCLAMLEVALATELTSMLRCRGFHFSMPEVRDRPIAIAFLVHSVRAQRNADGLAGRIAELGASPGFAPERLVRLSLVQCVESTSIGGMIAAAVSAERLAMQRYGLFLHQQEVQDVKTAHLLRSLVISGTSFIGELESLPARS